MIELKNINKLYKQPRQSDLHVLKDINLQLPEVGIVAICGDSGSGKSTLLNVIGGIDNINKGQIIYNDKVFEKKDFAKYEAFRRGKINFVFQEFNLIEEFTIKENIQLAIDLVDESYSNNDERIMQALTFVGMEKYVKRKVNTLSGGQKQRVAIARAIIIDSKVILADEPTGNLDVANSKIIMELLKKISKTRLIILVSHDKNLVNLYADTLVKLADKKISENIIVNKNNAENIDNRIYLPKDISEDKLYEKSESRIRLYSEDSVNLEICVLEDKIYIYGKSDQYKIIPLLEPEKLFAYHKEDIIKENNVISEDEGSLSLINGDIKEKVGFFNIKNIRSYKKTKLKKVLERSFVIIALFMSLIMCLSSGINFSEFQAVRQSHSNSITYWGSTNTSYNSLIEAGGTNILSILSYNKDVFFTFLPKNNYYQEPHYASSGEREYLIPISLISESDIVFGDFSSNAYEVVMDISLAEKYLSENNYNILKLGLTSVNSFVGTKIKINEKILLKIVGLCDTGSPVMYINDDMINGVAFVKYETGTPFVSNTCANYIKANLEQMDDNDVYISKSEYIEKIFSEETVNSIDLYGYSFSVKGYYENIDENNYRRSYIVNSSTLEKVVYQKLVEEHYFDGIGIIVKDKEEAIRDFAEIGLIFTDDYLTEYEDFKISNARNKQELINITLTIASATVIMLFFVVKSEVNNRKKEIAIRRCLGESKNKIIFGFVMQCLLITVKFAISAYVLGVLGLYYLSIEKPAMTVGLYFGITEILLGIVIMLLASAIMAVISSAGIVSKKPIELLK